MPRRLNFQIQRIRSSEAVNQVELLLHSLHAQAKIKKMKASVDLCIRDDYCNVLIESSEPKKLWRRFAAFVAENSAEFEWMKKRWIVILQGKSGWDDYLLLAHFDGSVRLDA